MRDEGAGVPANSANGADVEEAVEGGKNEGWPDEAAETAFRAEAKERGEPEMPVMAPVEATEETDTKGLPALEELVKKIPAESRELMDELFRAKFTGVKRVPAKALKS